MSLISPLMSEPLLRVKDLKTWFGEEDSEQGVAHVVDGVGFEIERGQTFALLGESGCGKSMTALSLMRLVPEPAGRIRSGSVELDGQALLSLPESVMRDLRGGRIGMIFQEPMTSLNPVMTVGDQIRESLERHTDLRGAAAQDRVIELLDSVGIPDASRRVNEYPHQMSGGMKQRVMIAMALAGEPELLIADEPTTALDVTIQAQVLDLLKEIQRQRDMAILLITHDLGVVQQMADEVAVMYAGQLVERASCADFFAKPRHPYSHKLFESLPDGQHRDRPLAVIAGQVPPLNTAFSGCRFVDRCDHAQDECRSTIPEMEKDKTGHQIRCLRWQSLDGDAEVAGASSIKIPEAGGVVQDQALLKVTGLKMHFPIRKGLLQRQVGAVKAVDGVDLTLSSGRTVAIVGESGCGKTTVAKSILQLSEPTAGCVSFEGQDLTGLSSAELRDRRRDMQIIFQDPYSSMNPRMRVGEIVAEGLLVQGIGDTQSRANTVRDLLKRVKLPEDSVHRYPHEFSGGQRQRISIARALALNPKMIVCDEPTSALDVSVQAQILNLLKELQEDLGLSYLFITHNIAVVSYLAHEVLVMYLGRVVEQGTVREVLETPRHPYTRALLSAVPQVAMGDGAVKNQHEVIRLEGDMPSPSSPPSGCHFHPRCPQAQPTCSESYPEAVTLSSTHQAHCHLIQ